MNPRKKVPFIQQMSKNECGAACLTMILHYYKTYIPLHEVNKLCVTSRNGVTAGDIKRASKSLNFDCKVYKISEFDEGVFERKYPLVVLLKNNHFVVIEKIFRDKILIVDPELGRRKIIRSEFDNIFSGIIIHIAPPEDYKPSTYQNYYIDIFKSISISKKPLLYSIVLTILLQICSLIIPNCTRFIIDNIILSNDTALLPSIFIIAFGTIIVYGILSYLRKYLMIKLESNFSFNFSDSIVKKLFKLPLEFFDIRSSSDIANRINNINSVKEVVSRFSSSVIIDLLAIIIFGIVMFSMSVKLSITVVVLGIIQAFLFFISINRIKNLILKSMRAQEVTYKYLIESINNILIVKSSNLENNIIRSWTSMFLSQININKEKDNYSNLFESFIVCIKLIPSVLLLLVGSTDVVNNVMSLGGLMSFISISALFLNPISSLVNSFQEIQYLKSVLDRLMEIIFATEDQKVVNSKNNNKISEIHEIEINNLQFRYSGSGPYILSNINLNIKQGEKIAFIGQTGCGKTTLLKILLGLYDIEQGEIKINDEKLEEIDISSYRNSIGVVLQDSYFFDDNIYNNINITKKYDIQKIEFAAKMASLDNDIAHMPLGYNTFIGENGKNISGGQRQRLAIARAILHEPSLIIFDEGTNQLDAITEKKIYRNLKQSNITQIVITHRLSTIKDADKIFLLNNGTFEDSGTHAYLLENNELYKTLWNKQND
ncbi:MAG TPA: ABC transporter permease [Thermosipho africanus]|nr:ABC transporter permease [Thermosipho africanus]